MNDALSAAIQEAYASAPVDVVLFDTLELRHPSFTAPIRVVNDHADLTATLEADAPANPGEAVLFVAFAFGFERPQIGPGGMPEFEFWIDNVGREISDNIEAALESGAVIELTYRPYVSTDLSAPSMDPPLSGEIVHVSATVFRVTGRVGFGDFGNRRFPSEAYTGARFPGLVR